MRSLIAAVLLLTLAAAAQAEERVTILDYGIVSTSGVKRVPAPGTVMGATNEVQSQRLVRQAETITAKLGTSFGVRYRFDGVPKGRDLTLKCITRFPEAGLTNPKGEKAQADEFDCHVKGGEATWRSFAFDEPWEMVPGIWNLEFWFRGEKIGEKRFLVVVP